MNLTSKGTPSPKCSRCDRLLPHQVADGICPRCLLEQAALPTEPETGAPEAHLLPPELLREHFPQLEINAPASRLKKSCRGVKSNFLL